MFYIIYLKEVKMDDAIWFLIFLFITVAMVFVSLLILIVFGGLSIAIIQDMIINAGKEKDEKDS